MALPCLPDQHIQSMFVRIGRKEGNVLFNDALNTFYLRLYGVRHMVKDHSDREWGNLLPPHGLLLPISSKGSFYMHHPSHRTMSERSYHGATSSSRRDRIPSANWSNTSAKGGLNIQCSFPTGGQCTTSQSVSAIVSWIPFGTTLATLPDYGRLYMLFIASAHRRIPFHRERDVAPW